MRTYTWLQAMRMLAGLPPGDPYVPSTTPPIPPLDPPCLREFLFDGVAVVQGVPDTGDLHEPVPAEAWRRVAIELRTTKTKDHPFEIVARLPGKHVPDLTESRSWSDLVITSAGIDALRASYQERAQELSDMEKELLTLEEATMIAAPRLECDAMFARQWLLDQFNADKLTRSFAGPVKEWQEGPIPGPGSGPPAWEPLPHPHYWRVRRAELTNVLEVRAAEMSWRTVVPMASRPPWTGLALSSGDGDEGE